MLKIGNKTFQRVAYFILTINDTRFKEKTAAINCEIL